MVDLNEYLMTDIYSADDLELGKPDDYRVMIVHFKVHNTLYIMVSMLIDYYRKYLDDNIDDFEVISALDSGIDFHTTVGRHIDSHKKKIKHCSNKTGFLCLTFQDRNDKPYIHFKENDTCKSLFNATIGVTDKPNIELYNYISWTDILDKIHDIQSYY